MSTLDELLGDVRLMLILRALDPVTTVERAEAAWDVGVPLVEVTIGTADGVKSLRAAVEAGRARGSLVAAGTVLTADAARAAADAGAAFTVAPGLDPEVLAASADAGLPHLPGVATPSEVQRAVRLGCHWLKVFPSASLGPQWFSAVRGPFPDLRLVATGGITPAAAPAFLAAGASAVGVGAAVADTAALAALTAALAAG
jgi:2-dehydro-3-deoxyphosphogluconate aldolase/(4S)-4-hydroxy-2-oxoglutarate aldolase